MNYDLLILGLWIWFPVAVISYRLREIAHIWGVSTTYDLRPKWMHNSLWWTKASPKPDGWFKGLTGFNLFDDAYHFFGQVPRIFLGSIISVSISWTLGIAAMLLWGMVDYIFMKFLVKKI